MKTAVKEKRIPFRPELVRAILDNRKTMTRRIVKPQPLSPTDAMRDIPETNRWWAAYATQCTIGTEYRPLGTDQQFDWRCPYGKVGDRLCIISAFNVRYDEARDETHWTAEGVWTMTHGKPMRNDGTPLKCGPRPSMFMPYWLSVEKWPLLELTEVRCERLQDISAGDCKAEGMQPDWDAFEQATCGEEGWDEPEDFIEECEEECDWVNYGRRLVESSEHKEWEQDRERYALRLAFRRTWDALNGKRGYSWDSNPWVWVLSFKPLTPSR